MVPDACTLQICMESSLLLEGHVLHAMLGLLIVWKVFGGAFLCFSLVS